MEGGAHGAQTYSGAIQNAVNKLSMEVLGKSVQSDFRAPAKYTGKDNKSIMSNTLDIVGVNCACGIV